MTHTLCSSVLMIVFTVPVFAQWIHIRTVPIIASNQGEFHPSLARGMGNLSISFDDPFGAPFINPAKASLTTGTMLFTSPTRNSWSNKQGRSVFSTQGSSFYPGAALNSVPLGTLFKAENYFGGAMFAYQEFKSERSQNASPWINSIDAAPMTRTDIASNTFLFGLFGLTIPDTRVSIGVNASWAELSAIDGVNLLYPSATDIKQDGKAWEVKIGALGELPDGDRLEFVAGRGVSQATHEVSYQNFRGPAFGIVKELNKDETREWLLHTAYSRPLGERWKIAAALSVNWKDHPKIPNYALANIPRDPGNSTAYNIGIAPSRSSERSFWGFEYVYEPITTNTWAEAGEQRLPPPNQSLPAEFKTVENFFDFSNHIVRVGHSSAAKLDWLDYRFGAQLHFYNYKLHQIDNIARTTRNFATDWLETTLSGGLTARIGSIRLMYTLQLILGNGLVGTTSQRFASTADGGLIRELANFLPAPSGDLVVDGITLVTQQLVFMYVLE